MSGHIVEVVKLVGDKAGKISVVMAGVHGNEPCGILAFNEILPGLKIESGTVYFILGNPNAIAENVRFTEFNLNRAFKHDSLISETDRKSYEYFRAQYLKYYLDQADALLDIHSSFTPNSIPFVICEDNALPIVRKLPAKTVTSGFDRVNPGGTDEYMNRIGKIGICIECGEHLNPDGKRIAMDAIQKFLEHQGHIPATPSLPIEQRRIVMESIYYSKTNDFRLAKDWEDFEPVTKGSIIGTDGGISIRAEYDGIILFARNCTSVGQEAFYFGREIKQVGVYGDWPKDGH